MTLFLAIVGWTLFSLAVLVGIALDLVGLFGNWVILGAVLIAWVVTGFEHFGLLALGVMLGLAILGELIESGAAGLGASQFGGSKGSIVAAIIGCVVGAVAGTPLFPVIGTLVGACLGAFIGAALHEYLNRERTAAQSMWTGAGAAMGKVFGLFAKALVGFIMLLVAAVTY
ncbi:MAG TPA: DUF456 domain-containing protein [Candidatus Hydrogenedentes bacterium]|jgi:uncharacterized protein YqgC (DUF456 family)|nr:DUF456 domain-containing protein [Candidatus Hydrogenedentota bacterium]MDY0031846.1 DUF456 domain-containing protein [FCB group bacterium]NLT61053.1 DUF456 domain-containing protein [Candidatus Hydrogenedentota bacterium]HNZ17699.1 DUF456 domain-containing protein [Candidatus Hydrogenedentota bacterium]HOH35319.1 DUF456 domain-containing protein [Candidatus Hydrogenedentota bacterium]